jgi:hypothetical protein
VWADQVVGVDATGENDSTEGLQYALNAGAGAEVWLGPGTYKVDATTGLTVSSGTTLIMQPGAELIVIPNAATAYAVLKLVNVSNVTIFGGTLTGDLDAHLVEAGQWGMGISISGGADHVIDGVTCRRMWGDGIYIAGGAQRVTISNVTCVANRRQGISVIAADDLLIEDTVCTDTSGHAPEAGIDLEPSVEGDAVNRATLRRCTLNANTYGVMIMTTVGSVDATTIEDCTMARNADCGVRLIGGTNTALARCNAPDNAVRAYDLRLAGTYTMTDCTP